jgi:isoleucyl-tRNA synthetase
VRNVVLKALEEARQAKFIGTSLEARVRLAGAKLDDYAADLPALFITSQVVLEPGDALKVTIERAEGTKCERCWKYSVFAGPVCDSCASALKEMLG